MPMQKPNRLLTPREREIRTLERGMSKLRARIKQLAERALNEGEGNQAVQLSEAADLAFRSEANLQAVRQAIHNVVKGV